MPTLHVIEAFYGVELEREGIFDQPVRETREREEFEENSEVMIYCNGWKISGETWPKLEIQGLGVFKDSLHNQIWMGVIFFPFGALKLPFFALFLEDC